MIDLLHAMSMVCTIAVVLSGCTNI